jgi:hypothetical protein
MAIQWKEGFERIYAILALVWIVTGIAVISKLDMSEWLNAFFWGVALPLLGIRAGAGLLTWALLGFREPKEPEPSHEVPPVGMAEIIKEREANDN